MISDKQLYQTFLDGDISAFEELVLKHRHNLIYFIMQYLKNYHSAEDIAQEIFAYIYLNPDKYNSTYEFKTYIFLLGKRRAIDCLRKAKCNKEISIDTIDLMDENSLEDMIVKKELASHIYEMLQEIKPEYRQVLILIYYNELTLAETALVLGKSLSSIKVISHRGKKKIKQILERRNIDEI